MADRPHPPQDAEALARFERDYLFEPAVAEHIARHARFLGRADAGLVGVWAGSTVRWSGVSGDGAAAPAVPVPLIDRVVSQQALTFVEDLRTQVRADVAPLVDAGWRAAAIIPLGSPGDPTGAFVILSRAPHTWTQEERDGLAHWIPLRRAMNAARAGTVRRAQAREQAAESRFRMVFEAAPVGLVVLDEQARFLVVNPAFERLTGRSRDELLTMRARDVALPMPGEAEPAVLDEWLAGKRDGYTVERTVTRPDGSTRNAVVTTVTARIEGAAPFLFSIVEDVTEERAKSEAIRERDVQLVQAQRREIVGQLAAGMAHDFNNTLAIISGFAALIQRTLDPASPIRGDAEQILKVVQRASGMTRRLLTFSRKQQGVTERFDLADLVRDFGAALRPMLPKTVRIVPEVPQEPVWAEADRGALDQVLLNLALNARDAMPDGGILTLRLEAGGGRAAEQPAMARISVCDTGVGIDATLLPLLWEPFFTTKAEGSGLGLPISRSVMRDLGGDLLATSAPGSGSTFTLVLPLAEQPVAPDTMPAAGELAGQGEWLLVVEDDPILLESTTRHLLLSGYRVMTAANGTEGFRTFLEHIDEIALIITDLDMPEMSGRELIARIRETGAETRILVTSGGEPMDDAERAGRVMENMFLPRPFTVAELLAAVRRTINAPAVEPAPRRLQLGGAP